MDTDLEAHRVPEFGVRTGDGGSESEDLSAAVTMAQPDTAAVQAATPEYSGLNRSDQSDQVGQSELGRESFHTCASRPQALAQTDDSSAWSSMDSVNSAYDDEELGLFDFAETVRDEIPPGEPWFMEMTRLRRLHFLWLNKELAAVRKKILENKRASDDDMRALQGLLRDQGGFLVVKPWPQGVRADQGGVHIQQSRFATSR